MTGHTLAGTIPVIVPFNIWKRGPNQKLGSRSPLFGLLLFELALVGLLLLLHARL